MARQTINVGTINGKDGDTIRDAFIKVNTNFIDVYNELSVQAGTFLIDGGTASTTFDFSERSIDAGTSMTVYDSLDEEIDGGAV